VEHIYNQLFKSIIYDKFPSIYDKFPSIYDKFPKKSVIYDKYSTSNI